MQSIISNPDFTSKQIHEKRISYNQALYKKEFFRLKASVLTPFFESIHSRALVKRFCYYKDCTNTYFCSLLLLDLKCNYIVQYLFSCIIEMGGTYDVLEKEN